MPSQLANRQALFLGEWVTPQDYGAVGDGTTDDTTAFNNALATGRKLYIPAKTYKLTGSLITGAAGQIIEGESRLGVNLITPSASTFEIIRIAHAYSEVKNVGFAPGGPGHCILSYSGVAHIHENRFLAATNGVGTAIKYQDFTPGNVFVPGAYNHLLYNNEIGYQSRGFLYGVDTASYASGGQNSNRYYNNRVYADRAFNLPQGGGNVLRDNMAITATGKTGIPFNYFVNFDQNTVSNTVCNNYVEAYNYCINLNATTNLTGGKMFFWSQGNTLDNTTQQVSCYPTVTTWSNPF